MNTSLQIKYLDDKLKQTGMAYATDGAAGLDCVACIERGFILNPGESRLIPLGFALHIGHAGIAALLLPRSGLGAKGLILGNSVGLIDSDYQGEVMANIWNRNTEEGSELWINPYDRIAQLIFVPVLRPQLDAVAYFSKSSVRGEGGFGSTGIGALAFAA
jgi:dUTP pyrophosphatase